MDKPMSERSQSREAEIRRCESKLSRARDHAVSTRSSAIRQCDLEAARFYKERIEELRRRSEAHPIPEPVPSDREDIRHLAFGLWAQ